MNVRGVWLNGARDIKAASKVISRSLVRRCKGCNLSKSEKTDQALHGVIEYVSSDVDPPVIERENNFEK